MGVSKTVAPAKGGSTVGKLAGAAASKGSASSGGGGGGGGGIAKGAPAAAGGEDGGEMNGSAAEAKLGLAQVYVVVFFFSTQLSRHLRSRRAF